MAAKQTTDMVIRAIPAYDRETDLELAEQSIAANLKMLEGVLEGSPNSRRLLVATSSSFSRYAYGFIEEQIDAAGHRYDFEETERLKSRAISFYERARQYGLRSIATFRPSFVQAITGDLDVLSSELQQWQEKDIGALFWTAFAWGGMIQLQQSDPVMLADLPAVKMIMNRVMELDESFYFASPHLFFGTYYGDYPEMLGGDPEMARNHIDRADELNRSKYLMVKFMLARYVAIPTQNRSLFEQTLQEVLDAPVDLFPEQALANQLAKRRAAHWLKRADVLF
jgi:hypothetical protein